MDGTDDEAYEDVPAASLRSLCPSCDGDGWVYITRAAAVGDRVVSISKPELCGMCEPSRAGEPSSGRVNFGTGPGAKLSKVQRARGPWDDWKTRP